MSQDSKVVEMHRRRTMFVIFYGNLIVAPDGCTDSHQEWLNKLLDARSAESAYLYCPRGYALDDRVVFYTGGGAHEGGEEMKKIAELYHARIAAYRKCNPDYEVWVGVKVGKVGEEWPPLEKLNRGQ